VKHALKLSLTRGSLVKTNSKIYQSEVKVCFR
jgi:hypothetical protein